MLKNNSTAVASITTKILFQLSGSIACFKACSVISALVKGGYEVQVVATPSALEFVGPATLEGLTGRRVRSEIFQQGEYMAHIHLMNWADLIILCPATANTLSKLANGIGDDLVSTLFLAYDFKKPYLVVPAMNTKMYLHPSTQNSLKILKSWQLEILETESGVLACGEEGLGRLLEPEQIMKAIQKKLPLLATNSTTGPALRVLITSGGTREAIDGVRSITNTSTGRTGAHIADYFSAKGHRVTFVSAQESLQPELPVQKVSFKSFADLQRSLDNLLKNNHFDAVVHAAAVSDFTIDKIETAENTMNAQEGSKLDSDVEMSLRLKKTPKLIDQIRRLSRNRDLVLVAFKLLVNAEAEEKERAVKKLFAESGADIVVRNEISEVHQSKHLAQIYDKTKMLKEVKDKNELASTLETIVVQQVALRKKAADVDIQSQEHLK